MPDESKTDKPKAVDVRTLAHAPKSLKRWIGEWSGSLAKKKPDDELVSAAQDMVLLAKAEAEQTLKEGEEWTVKEELAPAMPHLLWALAMLVRGKRYQEVEDTTGISFSRLHACAGVDKQGFGRVYDIAMSLRDESRLAKAQELLAERALEGTERPVVVRKGRDNDEIEMVKVKSDNLLIKAVEAGAARADKSEEKNATVNVGQAITYNIQAPQFILKNEPLKLVETNPLEGLKKSLE